MVFVTLSIFLFIDTISTHLDLNLDHLIPLVSFEYLGWRGKTLGSLLVCFRDACISNLDIPVDVNILKQTILNILVVRDVFLINRKLE